LEETTRSGRSRRTSSVYRLVEGIHRFKAKHFDMHRELYERLVKFGQKPEALFITCSDARVDPADLVQAEPGELFIVRNVGNLVPPYRESQQGASVGAAIQYAVQVLGVSDIIVCGHFECGAMATLLGPPEPLESLPMVRRWLRHGDRTRRTVDDKYVTLPAAARLAAGSEENVLVQLEHVRSYPFVAERLEEGSLHLHGWVYDIAVGEVYRYDPQAQQYVAILKTGELRSR